MVSSCRVWLFVWQRALLLSWRFADICSSLAGRNGTTEGAPDISFDAHGVCSECRAFDGYAMSSREERIDLLERIIAVYRRREEELAVAVSRNTLTIVEKGLRSNRERTIPCC